MQKYNFLYAGDDFIEDCEDLKSVIIKGKQFFYNPLNQSPIYQSIKVVREEGAFIGNYCNQASHIIYLQKVDPLFICILIRGDQLLAEKRGLEINQLFDVNLFEDQDFAKYFQQHKGVVQRLGLLFKSLQVGEELYYSFDIEKLFDFLDTKRIRLQQFLNTSQDFQDQEMNVNELIRIHNSEYYLISQYLTPSLSQMYNESRKILKNLEIRYQSDQKQYQNQHQGNKDEKQNMKKPNTNKAPTMQQQQQKKDAKTSFSMDKFVVKQPKN
ncbi:hypothetical protein pb186bvf_006388 [Paramecium bursaria]